MAGRGRGKTETGGRGAETEIRGGRTGMVEEAGVGEGKEGKEEKGGRVGRKWR